MANETVQSTIFRKKSIEKISSPEQLNEYLRVSTPSVWLLLAAIVILLVGVCVWAVTGHLDTTVSTAALAENGVVTAYITEADVEKIQPGQTVRSGEVEGFLLNVSNKPVQVDDTFDSYLLYTADLRLGEWVYPITLDLDCEVGVHKIAIVTESVSPMSFLLN